LAAALGLWQIAMTHQQIWTAMDRTTKQTTVIQVTGLQYAWAFRMPGPDGLFGDIDPKLLSKDNPFGLATSDPKGLDDEIQIGFLETTAGETLTFEIRTLDVIHSFYLPEFRSQVNAMPFNRVYLSVGPTQPGQYTIQCNQFCGLGHYRMQANWIVHPNPHNAENHLSSE
jgi:cytochrome c oxidase subunit 2